MEKAGGNRSVALRKDTLNSMDGARREFQKCQQKEHIQNKKEDNCNFLYS